MPTSKKCGVYTKKSKGIVPIHGKFGVLFGDLENIT